ncbi:hypothetical protein [Moraxella lacunata]|uniref:hypothetical protein n=1 Tax=Moraxella lacunata TaxID=477 RepID=UPI003EDFE04B
MELVLAVGGGVLPLALGVSVCGVGVSSLQAVSVPVAREVMSRAEPFKKSRRVMCRVMSISNV